MSELNALIGLKGLKYIDESIKNRKFRYQLYCNLLSDVENLSIPNIKDEWEYNYSYFPIFIRKGNKHREIIFNELANNSIYCRKYWSPLITKHDIYSQNKYDLNNANELSNQVLALPMGNNVTVSIINFICSIIKRSINA